MESHYQISDSAFESQFENCSLDAALFNHEAHLRLAWIHLRKYGEAKAIANICRQLQNFVKLNGAADKYNHTLTIAAIKAVHHFIQRSDADNFNSFLADFPQLKTSFRKLLNSHYSIDIFQSKLAKERYLEPDLLPF